MGRRSGCPEYPQPPLQSPPLARDGLPGRVVVVGGSAGVAPAMVWAGAWLGPNVPTVYHRLVVDARRVHTTQH